MIDVERVVTLDELMDRVPEDLVRDAESRREQAKETELLEASRNNSMTKDLSKAQRIRNYLEAHPECRNKDVVVALEKYNVTAADVANVKSNMKKSEANNAPVRRVVPAAAPATTEVSMGDAGPSLNLKHLEAAVEFVKLVGSVQTAQHLLIIVDRVKGA